jgi:branched-chain amino acid aminotransferase
MEDGRINVFRIDRHYERFVRSLERMCMAVIPKEIFTDGLVKLIELDKTWVPSPPSSLYIRPFMIATETSFGVKASDEYRFIIFTGPVPALFVKPVKVKVETEYIRAARGGTGYAKCGGNYGGALLPTKKARSEGYDQVLWTDSNENKFIEESGMMNVMFIVNDALVTPPLSDSILDGITRDSLLTIAKNMGYKTEERKISVQELKEGIADGNITEIFGTGTAALISPISVVGIEGTNFELPAYDANSIMFRLKKRLNDIRYGLAEDIYEWNSVI